MWTKIFSVGYTYTLNTGLLFWGKNIHCVCKQGARKLFKLKRDEDVYRLGYYIMKNLMCYTGHLLLLGPWNVGGYSGWDYSEVGGNNEWIENFGGEI